MEITCRLAVETRAAWRAWLAANHDEESEIWLVYNKKRSGRPRVAYGEAVEEALCFGWIDGIVKPIDENRYAQRFSPRRQKSNWSDLNRRRFARLVEQGLMTAAGLARGPSGRPTRKPPPSKAFAKTPAYILAALRRNRKAHDFFRGLAPSYRRLYVGWIDSAKREETRQKRLRKAISLLAQRRKPGLK